MNAAITILLLRRLPGGLELGLGDPDGDSALVRCPSIACPFFISHSAFVMTSLWPSPPPNLSTTAFTTGTNSWAKRDCSKRTGVTHLGTLAELPAAFLTLRSKTSNSLGCCFNPVCLRNNSQPLSDMYTLVATIQVLRKLAAHCGYVSGHGAGIELDGTHRGPQLHLLMSKTLLQGQIFASLQLNTSSQAHEREITACYELFHQILFQGRVISRRLCAYSGTSHAATTLSITL